MKSHTSKEAHLSTGQVDIAALDACNMQQTMDAKGKEACTDEG